METFEHFVFYPIIVLLGIFLVVLSFKFILRLILFCLVILLLWCALAYFDLVPSPQEYFPAEVQWLHDHGFESIF